MHVNGNLVLGMVPHQSRVILFNTILVYVGAVFHRIGADAGRAGPSSSANFA